MKTFLPLPNSVYSLYYRVFFSSLLLLFLLSGVLFAQTFNYGTGNISSNPTGFNTAGSFTGYSIVGNNLTVTGSINMPAGIYNFANVTINSGATVTIPTGTTVPFILRCTGSFVNNGDIRANGGNGGNASGATAGAAGLGCAGGTNGGVGGPGGSSATYPTSPLNFSAGGSGVNFGTSDGGGKRMCHTVTNNYPTWRGPGGGGGSYGTTGVAGGNGVCYTSCSGCATGGVAGTTYGAANLLTSAGASASFLSLGQTTAGDRWILGGSGGGGGGGTQSILTSARAAGGGGGGGGGAIQITANSITIGTGAWIRARGGNGGNGSASTGGNAGGGGGGGGSGGTINLQYMSSYTNNGTLQVQGGLGGGRGFATNGDGGDGGNGGSGRTLVEADVILCTPPTVSASSFSASSITTSSATLSWTRGNGDQVLVIVREGSAVSGGPVNTTSYTANSNFTLGDPLGGGRVVYIGSGTSVNVTSLPNLNTTYHVAIFEFFTSGGGCYQTLASAHTGTFTTANGPMTYVSSTNVQQTGNSPLGATNQPILRLEVVGGPGTAPPLSLTSVTFNTTGTTSTADLTGARMFYTGSSTTFSTATPFGSTISNPSGTHIITGSQTLLPGNNYFWLVYDISIVATVGNVFDAQITSVTAGSPQTPTVTNPAGNRTISPLMSLSCGYTFSHFTPTWTSNVGQPGTTVIASGAASIDDQRWPGVSFATGFTFEFNGKVYSSMGIHSKGFIWFGTTNPSGVFFTPISSTLGYEGAIAPFAFDMQAHSASTTTPQVSVRYTGTAPNRVCIIEWTAMRPYGNTGGLCPGFGFPQDWNRYDFQLHLYENGGTNANRIEFVYNDMNAYCVNANGANAQVGLRGATNTDFLNRTGSGNFAHTSSSAGTANTQVISHGTNNFFNGVGGMRFTPTFQIPDISPTGSVSNVCPSLTVPLSTTSPVSILQWYRDNLPISGATSSTYNADASGVHMVVATQSGCSKVSQNVTVTINPCGPIPTPKWTGAISSNWNVPGNWSTGSVPTSLTNVVIELPYTNPPVISAAPVGAAKNLTLGNNVTLTINSGLSLNVSGNIIGSGGSITGAGHVSMNGAVAQSISGNVNIANLQIDNSTAPVSLASGATLRIVPNSAAGSGRLQLAANANLSTSAGKLILVSNSLGTGYLAAMPATASIGPLTLQRFIPSFQPGWYFLGTPIQAQNITHWNDNFFTYGPMPGAHIPNPGLNTSSLFIHRESGLSGGTSPEINGWEVPTPTNNPVTAPIPGSGLAVGKGYRVYLNGNWRSGIVGFDNSGTPTVAPTGTPFNFNVTFTPGAYGGGGWNFVANPFPSAIDWDAASGWDRTNMDNAIYIWNKNIFASYVAGVGVNGGSNIIPSSQAFFVKANAASPLLRASESVKTNNSGSFLRTSTVQSLLRIKLSGNGAQDETAIRFTEEASQGFDPMWDAFKMPNPDINISSISMDNQDLSINTMEYLSEGEGVRLIPLHLSTATSGEYRLKFSGIASFETDVDIMLIDNFLNTITPVHEQTEYVFESGTAAGMQGKERFRLLVGQNVVTEKATSQLNKPILNVYPNPVKESSTQISLIGCQPGKGLLQIVDMQGKTWFEKPIQIEKPVENILIRAAYPSGVYQVVLKTPTDLFVNRLIVQ